MGWGNHASRPLSMPRRVPGAPHPRAARPPSGPRASCPKAPGAVAPQRPRRCHARPYKIRVTATQTVFGTGTAPARKSSTQPLDRPPRESLSERSELRFSTWFFVLFAKTKRTPTKSRSSHQKTERKRRETVPSQTVPGQVPVNVAFRGGHSATHRRGGSLIYDLHVLHHAPRA